MAKVFSFLMILILSASVGRAGDGVNNGGDPLKNDPPSTEEVVAALRTARRQVYLYLNFARVRNRPEFAYLYKTLRKTVFDQIFITNLEVHLKKPCLDKKGVARSATSIGSKPNLICFSVPQLKKKLTRDNLDFKIMGLVIHEYHHRMGIDDEKEIERIQKFINEDISLHSVMEYRNYYNSFYDTLKAYINTPLREARINWLRINFKILHLLIWSTVDANEQLKEIYKPFQYDSGSKINLNVFSPKQMEHFSSAANTMREFADLFLDWAKEEDRINRLPEMISQKYIDNIKHVYKEPDLRRWAESDLTEVDTVLRALLEQISIFKSMVDEPVE